MFKILLSTDWEKLAPAIQAHYGIADQQTIKMEGVLDVKHGKWVKWLMPLIRLTGALVPIEGKSFKVTVENKREGEILYWHRVFQKEDQIFEFDSSMQRFGDNIVEFVGLGVGIRMKLHERDGGVVYEDKGYVLKLGNRLIPVPIGWMLGKSHIEEYPMPNEPHRFKMKFVMQHPLFGFGFSYMGELSIVQSEG